MASKHTNYIACFGLTEATASQLCGRQDPGYHFYRFATIGEFLSTAINKHHFFKAILVESQDLAEDAEHFQKSLRMTGFGHLPFCLLTDAIQPAQVRELHNHGVREIFSKPIAADSIVRKLQLMINAQNSRVLPEQNPTYKLPLNKRLFDLFFASLALLVLSPLFALVALLIRLESRGPVFYYSLRVGTGYRIFKFYKFRSMSVDADKKLSQLKHLNQYSGSHETSAPKVKKQCDACVLAKKECEASLYADNEMWCEKLYKEHLQQKGQQAFVKIKDDPRITRVGKFIRNTSIDELPQLWNVIKGDMSLVGNRPLPLYEAEKLTTDKFALRFMAPAGITGLWQVSKRGKGKMSEEERIGLDNDYAKSYGLLFDIKLLMRTIPALLQKENV